MPAAVDPRSVDYAGSRVIFHLKNSAFHDENLDPEVRWALEAALMDMVTKTQFAAFKRDVTFQTYGDSVRHTHKFEPDFVQLLTYGVRYAATPFTKLRWITERRWLESQQERNTTVGLPTQFFITTKDKDDGLWQFRLNPTPDSVIPLTYTYLSLPASIYNTVAGEDQMIDPRFPGQFLDGLIKGAACGFPQYLDGTTLQKFMHDYENTIKDMANKSEPTSGALLQKDAYETQGRFLGSTYYPHVSLRP